MKTSRAFLYALITLILPIICISNHTIANDSQPSLIYSLVTPDDGLVRAVVQPHSWQDETAVISITRTEMDGLVQWQQDLVMSAGSRLRGMVGDSQGNIYMVGRFRDQFQFADRSIQSRAAKAFFLLSLDVNGELRFLKAWESETGVQLSGIQVSALGELWLYGQSQVGDLAAGNMHFDNETPCTFWLRFNQMGEFDRGLTLGQQPQSSPHPSTTTVGVQDIDIVNEGDSSTSLLHLRDLRFEGRGDRPQTTDDDPLPDPEPPTGNGPPPL